MTLTLTLRSSPAARVPAFPLTPDRLRGLNVSKIAAVEVRCGREMVAVGDLFELSGAADERLVLDGDLRGFDGIGAGLTAGEIVVHGDAGGWAGAGMSGGVLRILGDAGPRLGAAYPGARVGMTGGEIVVSGDAGEEAGAGLRMLAGTVIALGGIGVEAGLGNKRGSLVSGRPVEPLPSYQFATRFRPPALQIQLRRSRELGLTVDDALLRGAWARWSGDRTELTRGEILIFDGENDGR